MLVSRGQRFYYINVLRDGCSAEVVDLTGKQTERFVYPLYPGQDRDNGGFRLRIRTRALGRYVLRKFGLRLAVTLDDLPDLILKRHESSRSVGQTIEHLSSTVKG